MSAEFSTNELVWSPSQTMGLVDLGYAVTWKKIDDHYVVTATNDTVTFVGSSVSVNGAWTRLTFVMKRAGRIISG